MQADKCTSKKDILAMSGKKRGKIKSPQRRADVQKP